MFNLTVPLNKFTTDKYLHSCSNILNNIFTREQSQLCDDLVDVKRLLTVLCGRINVRRLLQPAAPPLHVPYLSGKQETPALSLLMENYQYSNVKSPDVILLTTSLGIRCIKENQFTTTESNIPKKGVFMEDTNHVTTEGSLTCDLPGENYNMKGICLGWGLQHRR